MNRSAIVLALFLTGCATTRERPVVAARGPEKTWPKTYEFWETFIHKNCRKSPFRSENKQDVRSVVLIGYAYAGRRPTPRLPLVLVRSKFRESDLPSLGGREFVFASDGAIDRLCDTPGERWDWASKWSSASKWSDVWIAAYCSSNHVVRGFRSFARTNDVAFFTELGLEPAISNEIERLKKEIELGD